MGAAILRLLGTASAAAVGYALDWVSCTLGTLGSLTPPWQQVSPPASDVSTALLREQFDAELALGEGYQRAYQEFEAAGIAAGVPIADDHFFDEFHARRPPIASPAGPEETFVGVPRSRMRAYAARHRQAYGVPGAGLAAMASVGLRRIRHRRAARPVTRPGDSAPGRGPG